MVLGAHNVEAISYIVHSAEVALPHGARHGASRATGG